MSATPEVSEQPAQTDQTLKACPRCNQEMFCDGDDLPLHMDNGVMCLGSATVGQPSKFGQQIKAPLTIPDVAQLSVSEVLIADTCWSCGSPKTPGQTICRTCYWSLPFLHQRCLPPYIKGYLFSDEHQLVAGHYTKAQFMDVLKSALEALAKLRWFQ